MGLGFHKLKKHMKNKTTFGLFWVVAAVLASVTGQVMATPPPPVPDAGSSALLLGAAFAGVAAYRRIFGRK